MASQTTGPAPVTAALAATIRDMPLAMYSRFVQRVRRRYARELDLLPAGLPDRSAIVAVVERLQAEGSSLVVSTSKPT